MSAMRSQKKITQNLDEIYDYAEVLLKKDADSKSTYRIDRYYFS